jgi:hypothetical protein
VSDPPIDEVIDTVFNIGEEQVVEAVPVLEPEVVPDSEPVSV